MPRGRRHSTRFGDIGFGNSQTTFSQSSEKPFSSYKEKIRKLERIADQGAILILILFSGLTNSVFHLVQQINMKLIVL